MFELLAAAGLGLAIAVRFALPETLARDRPRLTSAAAFGSFVSDGVFVAALLGGGFLAGVVYVYQVGAPRLFIVDWGLSPGVYGCFGFVTGAGYVAVTTFLARRKTPFRPAKLAAVGGAWAAAGAAAFLIEIAAGIQNLWVILPTMAVVSVGLGFGVPGTTAAALQRHGRAAGAASALLGCGTIGMGSLGTFLLSEAGHGQPMVMTVVMAASGVAAVTACGVLWRWDTAAARATAALRVAQPST